MWDRFEYDTFWLFFLGQHSFGIIIEPISELIFCKSIDATSSVFPTGFRKFRLPDLSGFGFCFLLAVILISHVFRVFHKFLFDFTGLIGGDIFWFSPHSTVFIKSSFLFRILFFFDVFIR